MNNKQVVLFLVSLVIAFCTANTEEILNTLSSEQAEQLSSLPLSSVLHNGEAFDLLNVDAAQRCVRSMQQTKTRCGNFNGAINVCCQGFFCNFPNTTCGFKNLTDTGVCDPIPANCSSVAVASRNSSFAGAGTF